MTKPPDLEALARRYVELWQDQVAAAAADPEMTEALVRMMQLAGSGLAATTAMWQSLWTGAAASSAAPNGRGGEGQQNHDGSARYPSLWAAAPAPGAAPLADPSPVGGRDLAELDARLAFLEKRLAAMESKPKPARRRPRKRARRDLAS